MQNNTTKQRMLAVDDEPRNLKIIGEIFEDKYEIKFAANGEEALGLMDTFQPDLVLLDIMMTGIDGYEICKRIKTNPQFSFTKVILVSGKAMINERLRGYEFGADDYMTKPFVPEELLAKAKVFLKLTQIERDLFQMNLLLDQKVQEKTKLLFESEGRLVNSARMAALGEMASGIAHEINSPLTVVVMTAKQLEKIIETGGEPNVMIKKIQMISKTAIRIADIIKGLRTFSREGSSDPMEPTLLKEIVENTMSLCNEKFKDGNVEISIDPIPPELKVLCRPVQISQVLLNLLNNSFDAMSARPEKWIQIKFMTVNDSVKISIVDSGHGIPKDIADKLFEPFFTTKDVGKGTGLGLSISKGIAESHHGKLEIDENCKNTCFVVTLPQHSVPSISQLEKKTG